MKTIKLLFVLTFGLWADFKLDIPNDVNVSKLENIVNHGWNEDNKTLNNFIVSNAERVMPEILEKIKKPILKVMPSKDKPFPVPNLILHKYDYWFIVSYCRYLEHVGKKYEALDLYVKILHGFNEIDDKSMLSVIFRMTMESMVVESIIYGVKNKYYSKLTKIDLKDKIKDKLSLDYSTYFISIEKEKKFVLDATYLSFFNKEEESLGYNNLMKAAYESLEKYLGIYFSKMTIALKSSMENKNNIAVNNFINYIQEEKAEHQGTVHRMHFVISGAVVKLRSLMNLGGQEDSYMAEYMGKTLALIAIPLIKSTHIEYAELIEKNKSLLKKLE